MAGKSPVTASDEQRAALEALAVSRNRGEADRARAILLTLDGWTSARIAEVFRVREDTVRQRRTFVAVEQHFSDALPRGALLERTSSPASARSGVYCKPRYPS